MTTTGTAMRGAFSYLMAQLPAVVAAVDANGVVNLGPTLANSVPPAPAPIVYVGATDPGNPTAVDGTRNYLELGARNVDEDFHIPCYIDVSVESADQAGALAIALNVYDGVVGLISSDLTLGGALLAGRWAEVVDIFVIMTDVSEATLGRRAVVTFKVHCTNHYKP